MPSPLRRRRILAPLLLTAGLIVPSAASAANPPPLSLTCTTAADGVRECGGAGPGGTPTTVPMLWETATNPVPIDVNVALPPLPASGTDGGYPLVILPHGYGGHKTPFDGAGNGASVASPEEWALRGYAVVTNSDRGFWGSCGTPVARTAGGAGCAQGWNRLMQAAYEVRDAQYLAGVLVDQGWVDPGRIGATGYSYGGGESLLLGTLRDRVMKTDGTLAPWTSPSGTPMRMAGAAPLIPWSDLIASLTPNGHLLDYTIPPADAAYTDDVGATSGGPTHIGVEKSSFVSGLYAAGQFNTGAVPSGGQPAAPDPSAPPNAVIGYYSPPGADPNSDLTTDFGLTGAGEPYESKPQTATLINSFRDFRGAIYLLNGGTEHAGPATEAPAPMLISNGFTDDLFPVDEAVRYYNQAKALFPSTPLSLVDLDYGHMRGQNKAPDTAYLKTRVDAWMDHYVKGSGPDPGQSVTALTQTCPAAAPSGGPFTADSWVGIHPGVLGHLSTTAQTISSSAGDPTIAKSIDPVAGSGACATAPGADQGSGVASYDLPPATGGGYTMLGSPIVVAQLGQVTGSYAQIDERLWDVAPGGTETLVDRGVYRVPTDTRALQYFELHPGAWTFAPGHHPKLELLGQDTPYARPSNGSFTISINALDLLLPTHETSGNGIVPLGALPAPAGAIAAPGIRLTGASPFRFVGAARGCSARTRVSIPVRYGSRGRVISAVATVGRRRLRSVHGRNIRSVALTHLPTTVTFTLRVVVRTSKGYTITSTRSFRSCRVTRRRDSVHRRHRH